MFKEMKGGILYEFVAELITLPVWVTAERSSTQVLETKQRIQSHSLSMRFWENKFCVLLFTHLLYQSDYRKYLSYSDWRCREKRHESHWAKDLVTVINDLYYVYLCPQQTLFAYIICFRYYEECLREKNWIGAGAVAHTVGHLPSTH